MQEKNNNIDHTLSDENIELKTKEIDSKVRDAFLEHTNIEAPKIDTIKNTHQKKNKKNNYQDISGLAFGLSAAYSLLTPIIICWGLGFWWDNVNGSIVGQIFGIMTGMPIGLLTLVLTLSKLQRKK